MHLTIVGSGYVRMTVAAYFADCGHNVVNVDVSAEVVDTINAGEVPINEEGLEGAKTCVKTTNGHEFATLDWPSTGSYTVSPSTGNTSSNSG